ncbi:MAG TPA: class I SAM-dependent methyltransferase [Chitinophagaceae bacterium]|nr:class I SAM-dependent methyltransferase [Chitinophagaceae bacterium]
MEGTRLKNLFYSHQGKLIHKWDHYFDVYEKHFSRYIGKKVNILEIGISHGGSMQLWKKYFGDQAHIYAIDVEPQCKKLEEPNTTVFIGSQSDPDFLQQVMKQLPDLDIIIDDGGHTMQQQKVSFETLYLKLKDGGVYIIEDTHTSYWQEFNGGLRNRNSFIEYSKKLIDSLYAAHIVNKSKLRVDEITQHIQCISFYDSMVVFEKQKRPQPFHIRKGEETLQAGAGYSAKPSLIYSIRSKFFNKNFQTFIENDRGKL